MSTTVNLQSILDANKLTNANFINWLRNLRIVLRAERIAYVLDGRFLEFPVVDAFDEDQNAYQKNLDDNVIATCILLASLSPKLQKQHEAMTTHVIIVHLKKLFHKQARFERFDVSKLLFHSKM